MKAFILTLSFLPITLFAQQQQNQQQWLPILQKYLQSDSQEDAQKILPKLLNIPPLLLLQYLKKGLQYSKKQPGWIEFKVAGMPAALYVPQNYDHKKPTPILFFLHGGINRPQFVPLEKLKQYVYHLWGKIADKNGWLLCAPASKNNIMWWQPSGTLALQKILLYIKRRFNINESNIWIAGFSDGASGAFHLAANSPTHFSAFVPLNGNPLVPIKFNSFIFLENFKNRPLYIVHTTDDPLYPASLLKPIFNQASNIGAHIIHRILKGTHNLQYLPSEIHKIVSFLNQNPLQPHNCITWFVHDTKNYNRCDWILVHSLKKGIGHKPSLKNPLLYYNRKILGIRINQQFKGPGVKVEKVLNNSIASKSGIKPNDIILKINQKSVNSVNDLRTAFKSIPYNQKFSITIKRNNKTINIKTLFPKPKPFKAFKYPKLWGAIFAQFNKQKNTINIKAYNINKFSLLLSYPLFLPNQPLKIIVNSKIVYHDIPKPNTKTILKFARHDLNRLSIVWTQINIILHPQQN